MEDKCLLLLRALDHPPFPPDLPLVRPLVMVGTKKESKSV